MNLLMKWPWISFVLYILLFAFVFLFQNITNTRHTFSKYQINKSFYIVFVPGLGLQAKAYQTLIADLQRNQYQVITFTPDYTNASNYQYLIKEWANKLSKQIGDKKVVVIGHSVGGSVAAYFCSIDSRCVGGVNMDGSAAFDKPIPVPFLYLQADTGSYCDTQCYQGRALMEKIASQSGATFIHISGIKHYNFTDLRTTQLKKEDYLGPIDGRNYIDANIEAFLKNIATK